MTHEERLALITRPFFRERQAVSYPWSGTIVANQFARSIEDLDQEAQELEAFVRRMREAYENDQPAPSNTGKFLDKPAILAAVRASAEEGIAPERIATYFDLTLNSVVQIQRAHIAHLRRTRRKK